MSENKKLGPLGTILKKYIVSKEEIKVMRQVASAEPVSDKKREIERIIEVAIVNRIATEILLSFYSEKMEQDLKFRTFVSEITLNRVNVGNLLNGKL